MSKCELKDILHEDIEDITIQLEDSFGITFADDAFKNVQTFGDLISVIESNLTSESSESCTSQQAFYRVRKALRQMGINQEIKPNVQLSAIFPKTKRRTIVKEFVSHLKIDIKLLRPHSFVLTTNLVVLLMGVILLFTNPLIGMVTTGCSIAALRPIVKYGTQLRVKDIRELSELLKNEKYSLTRSSQTINRSEIWNVVVSYFKPYKLTELTIDSKFEWAK